MKKLAMLSAFIIALLLTGCGETEDISEDNSAAAAVQVTASETAVTSAETVTSTETEAASETASASELNKEETAPEEVQTDGGISMPSDSFIEEAFKEKNVGYWIKYSRDGKFSVLDSDEYYNICLIYGLTEESYERNKENIGVGSYEEYKAYVYELYGLDEDYSVPETDASILFYIDEPLVLCDDYYIETKDTEAEKAIFRYTMSRLCSPDEVISDFLADTQDGNVYTVCISAHGIGDIFIVSAYAASEADPEYFRSLFSNEYISLSGEEVNVIGGQPVSADIKSLYISAYDETRAAFIDGGISEEYDCTIYGLDENSPIDIRELAENFPDLERIYFSKYAGLENAEAFAEFENLKELHIDISGQNDLSFLGKIGAEKLYISGLDKPADSLAKSPAKELIINCIPEEGVLESIFGLNNVTELEIERYSGCEPVLDGIEKLTSLKRLEVSSYDKLDIAPIAKLASVEELYIQAYKVTDLDKISYMKSVKRLTLHSMETADLKFLSEMTGLEELLLYYVNSSFNSSLSKLTKVKRLGLFDIVGPVNFKELYKMKSTESLHIMGISFDCEGISGLGKLNHLDLSLCSYSDLSELKKCTALKNLVIYNCDTPEFDAKDIEGMTWLEYLGFSCSEISNYKSLTTLKGLTKMNLYFCNLSDDEIAELKKALPDCEIKIDTDD